MKSHVLIVDDASDQLQLMQHIFKMTDPSLQIRTASSGDEALKLLREEGTDLPKVILLDLKMPGKTGQEVLGEIKADPNLRNIPVCTFSNGDVQSDICECYQLGASIYFRKPFGLQELKSFANHFRSLWFKYASHCYIPVSSHAVRA